MINFLWYKYEELNTAQLYDILSFRQDVFILEQQCFYQDIDYKDQWHYLKPRHALRSIYHVFSLIWFLQFFVVSASFEMASIAA